MCIHTLSFVHYRFFWADPRFFLVLVLLAPLFLVPLFLAVDTDREMDPDPEVEPDGEVEEDEEDDDDDRRDTEADRRPLREPRCAPDRNDPDPAGVHSPSLPKYDRRSKTTFPF